MSPVPELQSFEVWREHPRLFLTEQRLRRLRRERERSAPRWQQFETLIRGRARMPEDGFAQALYFQVTGEEEAARRAVEAAAGDLRQAAIVYDWCQPHAARLRPAIEAGLKRPPAGGVRDARARALAAVATGNAAELERVVNQWWRREIIPAIQAGRNMVPPGDMYALFELLHAIHDNLSIDLRDSLPDWFKTLPEAQVIGYYPAIYPAAENDYRIPATKGAEPDLTVATLARAADLAMVAYDPNQQANQYLQGWAMHDRFMLRSPLGAPYEFLWANPYLPGLGYQLLPPLFHDELLGRLFVRANWQDGAAWLGWFDGELQTFSEGEPRVVPLQSVRRPYRFGDVVIAAPGALAVAEEARTVFVVGLAPRRIYQVEPDDEEMDEVRTDAGGILRLEFEGGFRGGIRIRPAASNSTAP